jgi:hypothetical protein
VPTVVPTIVATSRPTAAVSAAAPTPQAPPAQSQPMSWALIAAGLSLLAAIVLAILGWRRIA